MKKLLLSLLLGSSVCFNAQTTLLDENFESYTDFAITGFGSWLTLDIDQQPTYSGGGGTWTNIGTPQAYMIFNPTVAGVTNSNDPTGELRNFDPHSGSKYAAAWNAVPTATVPGNEDWLISPAITLGSSANELTFWVKSLSDSYGLEKYKVGIYTGSGTPTASANFTIISGAAPLSAPYTNWEMKTYNLDAYAGQTIRIGIQCVSQDNYMFMVDDVKVTTATLSTSEVDGKSVGMIYPNPATDMVYIKSSQKVKSVNLFDQSGRKVMETQETVVNIESLSKGVYLMEIHYQDGSSETKKIVKK